MAESTNESWSPGYSAGSEDQDFDPSAEMLVHEFDDERTLEEEEEARESEHNFSSEVEDLEKEGEMPLEELLALYGYGTPLPAAALPGGGSPESDLPDNLPEMTLDKEEIAKDLLSGEDDESQSSADDLMPSVISNGTQDIFGCSFQLDTEIDGNEGTDFSDEDECVAAEERKTVMVGSQYQAIIPAGLCHYEADSGPADGDELQWDPRVLPESQVLLYLREAAGGMSRCRDGPGASALPSPLLPPRAYPDDDHALRELMVCNYDTREALARLRLAPPPPRDEMHKWTDEERLKFEEGFRLHYKDFHVIHTLVGTKSVAECVAFYYVWKKSRRLEFMQQSRMGKRKGSLQPGLVDGVELEGEGSVRALAPLLATGTRRERISGDDGHAVASAAADLAVQVLESLSSSDLGLTCTDMLLLRGGGGGASGGGRGCSGGDGVSVAPSGSSALAPFLTAVLNHPPGGSWNGTSAESSCLPLADGGPSTPDSVAHSTTSSSVGEDQEVPAKRLKLELYGDGSLSADPGASSSSSSSSCLSSSSSLSAEGSEPGVRLALDLGAVEASGHLLSAHVLRHPPPAAPEPCSQ